MVGALHPRHRKKGVSVVGRPRRCINALARFLLQFFCVALCLVNGFIVTSLAIFAAVDAGVADGLLLHHGKRRNG